MTLDLLVRICASSLFLTLGALAAERALTSGGRPVRGAWAGALAGSAAAALLLAAGGSLPLHAPDVVETVSIQLVGAAGSPAGGSSGAALAARLGALLTAAWLTATLVLFLVLSASLLRQVRLVRQGTSRRIDGVDVVVTGDLGPGVAGLVRPRIVVPAWLPDLPPPDRRLILRHEAEHVSAWDHHLALGALLLCCLMPWHPFLWYQRRRLKLAIELDCDRRVVRGAPEDRGRYGLLLIEVAERLARGTPLATALAHPRSSLERRIRMITKQPGGPVGALAWGIAAAAAVVVACADATGPKAEEIAAVAGQIESADDAWQHELWATEVDEAGREAGVLRLRGLAPSEMAPFTGEPRVEGLRKKMSEFSVTLDETATASIRGKQLLKLDLRLDEEGRAQDVRFDPGTSPQVQDRARQALGRVRLQSSSRGTGEWTPAIMTLP